MRRGLVALVGVLGLGSVALLVWSTRSNVPLPWRGSVTRHVWGDVLRGAMPRPTCLNGTALRNRMHAEGAGHAPTARALGNALPTHANFFCNASRPGERYSAAFSGGGGRLTEYTQSWSPEAPRGRQVRDSVLAALTRRHGPPYVCRPRAPTATTLASVHLTWVGEAVTRDLIVSFPPAERDTLPYGWDVYLRTAYQRLPCAGGA